MFKIIIPFLIITIIPLYAFAGKTATLRFSLIIPAKLELKEESHISQENTELLETNKIISEENKKDNSITTTEKTIKEGKEILLKTIVAK
ncbi:MAG: hypothetical protein JSV34_03075 [Candidatus Omnitrophota bacterium]|nr:MAG: hypothetical protein JSV34_03075 [Candidatus Omnitrophota bacterium]